MAAPIAEGSVLSQRYSFTSQILGASLFDRVQSSKVLVVGAGGIGCEVLKDLVISGFGHIEIIDLDTIDLSNLNRQFLFNKGHIKKSKSLVAASVAQGFNPHVVIKPYHGNIKEKQFGYDFFKRFDVVLNALDNLDARRWVNRMCVATGVPLVESGTTGFLGQVQPIVKGVTSCYDCTEKPVQKTYPVCTIRSTPSTPIHCVVWAKTWLFTQLFGQDDETETAELDKAEADGGNSEEISALRKEASEMRHLRESLLQDGAAQRAFDKVFKADVERLLSMDEMWRNRRRPTPLSYTEAIVNGSADTASTSNGDQSSRPKTLRDQTQLDLKETAELFTRSLNALAQRAAVVGSGADALSFDKDDDDALDFVTAASNLRSRVYGIEPKTRFDIKQMAGNIIPAIASTNAIISGALVLQALHLFRADSVSKAKDVMLGRSTKFILSGTEPGKPNPACGVCADIYVPVSVTSTEEVTLGQLIDACKLSRSEGGLGLEDDAGWEELGIYEGSRLLSDPDFDDNHEKSLASLSVEEGKFLAFVDEDGKKATVQLIITGPASADQSDTIRFPPASELPELKDRPAVPAAGKGDDDDDDDELPSAADAGDADAGFEINEDPAASAAFAAAKNATTNGKRRTEVDAEESGAAGGKRRRRETDDGVTDKAVDAEGDVEKKRRKANASSAGDDDDIVVLD